MGLVRAIPLRLRKGTTVFPRQGNRQMYMLGAPEGTTTLLYVWTLTLTALCAVKGPQRHQQSQSHRRGRPIHAQKN